MFVLYFMGFHKQPPPVEIGAQQIFALWCVLLFTRLYQGINQHCIHLVGPLWNPKGTDFYKQPTAASVKSWRMMWITTLLPPQGLLPTQLAILHEDEDAHPYHAVHVRWGPNPQGFFRQRGFGNMPDEGKGCDIQSFLWGWSLYAQISWHFKNPWIWTLLPARIFVGKILYFHNICSFPTGRPTVLLRVTYYSWPLLFLVYVFPVWRCLGPGKHPVQSSYTFFACAFVAVFMGKSWWAFFQFDLSRLHPVAYLQPS